MSPMLSNRFKFRFHIEQLRDAAVKYKQHLHTQADKAEMRHNVTQSTKDVEKGAYVVGANVVGLSTITVNAQQAVPRILAALDQIELYSFIRVDDLLLSAEELDQHTQNNKDSAKRKAKQRRLEALFPEVRMMQHSQPFITCG